MSPRLRPTIAAATGIMLIAGCTPGTPVAVPTTAVPSSAVPHTTVPNTAVPASSSVPSTPSGQSSATGSPSGQQTDQPADPLTPARSSTSASPSTPGPSSTGASTRGSSGSATPSSATTSGGTTRQPSRSSQRPPATSSPAGSSPPATADQHERFNSSQPAEIPGWTRDFVDGFDGGFSESRWGRYGWGGNQRPGNGAMGRYDIENVTVRDGALNLAYRYVNGEWTSAGVSGAPSFTAVGGRWEFRARFPQGRGFGFAFLLWPANEQWPPEVDILEGHVNGPEVSAFLHLPDPYRQFDARLQNPDLQQWHTYGVILTEDQVIFTLDGQPWATLDEPLPPTRMWIGFQTGAIDPEAPQAVHYNGGVPGGVPNPETPAEASIEIDWVAHYRPS